MLAHNEHGLDIGDLCVVKHEANSQTPKAYQSDKPTHKVVWLKQAVGAWRSIVALEELPEEKVFTDERREFWLAIKFLACTAEWSVYLSRGKARINTDAEDFDTLVGQSKLVSAANLLRDVTALPEDMIEVAIEFRECYLRGRRDENSL